MRKFTAELLALLMLGLSLFVAPCQRGRAFDPQLWATAFFFALIAILCVLFAILKGKDL